MKSFGSDPEFMIQKGGSVVSAIGVISGSKKNRIHASGHEFFYDNVLAECAIKPGKTRSQVMKNFKQCFKLFADMADPFKIAVQSSHDFKKSELKSPEAKEVGCDPDWCAYIVKQMPQPEEDIKKGTLRTCGGHIHVGDKSLLQDNADPYRFVYLADLLLAIPSLWLDKDTTSIVRRKMYGQAGRYRTKEKYGLEYRTLSNFWLKSPQLVGWVYDVCEWIIGAIKDGQAETMYPCDIETFVFGDNRSDAFTFPYDRWELKRCIDESDQHSAEQFLEQALNILPVDLAQQFHALDTNCDFYSAWELN